MKKTTRKAIRQRKICMLLIIILIIVLSILGGGYYLLSQKNAASSKAGGQNSDSRNQTDLNQNSDTVEYKGEIYKYNNHLSNYLFTSSSTPSRPAYAVFLISASRRRTFLPMLPSSWARLSTISLLPSFG